jgi:hypothetical protein
VVIGVIGISCGRGICVTESGNDKVDVCVRFIVFTGPDAVAGTGTGTGADADDGTVEVVVVVVVVLVGVDVTLFDGLGCWF